MRRHWDEGRIKQELNLEPDGTKAHVLNLCCIPHFTIIEHSPLLNEGPHFI